MVEGREVRNIKTWLDKVTKLHNKVSIKLSHKYNGVLRFRF